jgi:hypothetical protein
MSLCTSSTVQYKTLIITSCQAGRGVGSKTADICHGILQQASLAMSQRFAFSLLCQRKYGDIARLPSVLVEDMAVNPPTRSAVLFSLKAYNLALDDIRLALEVSLLLY